MTNQIGTNKLTTAQIETISLYKQCELVKLRLANKGFGIEDGGTESGYQNCYLVFGRDKHRVGQKALAKYMHGKWLLSGRQLAQYKLEAYLELEDQALDLFRNIQSGLPLNIGKHTNNPPLLFTSYNEAVLQAVESDDKVVFKHDGFYSVHVKTAYLKRKIAKNNLQVVKASNQD